jgi:plastocyanin
MCSFLRTRSFLLALAAGLLLAACGSSDSKSSGGVGSSGGGGSSGGTGAVTMKNTAFEPGTTNAKVGEKVTWTNEDPFGHNVTATSGGDFKSGNFGQNKSFSFTPDKAGTIKYTCTLHPGMDGTLTVAK